MFPSEDKEWTLIFTFDTREQAQMARNLLMGVQPKRYSVACTVNRAPVWTEEGTTYGAANEALLERA